VGLGDEDELARSLFRPEIEELVLVSSRRNDPAIMPAKQRSNRLLEPCVLPRRQGDDLEAVGHGGLARPRPNAVNPSLALIRQREQHRDSGGRRHARRVYAAELGA
jgi:hypothetical protein